MVDADLALLDRWCAGDAAAGNQLFNRHFTTLYKFFEHKVVGEVDDLVQETFLECVKVRDKFKRQSTFRTYLFAIARHVLFHHWRRKAEVRPTLDFEDISIESLSTSVGTRLANRSDRARVLMVLQALPLDQQLLLEMYYWQELDRDQLAEVFEVETATIGSRLHRARQTMKDMLETDVDRSNGGRDMDGWLRSFGDAKTPG
jgi:RNA polymerase sigma factor (sigma-70 family)